MTYADAKKGEIVGGFKCIGQIRNGLWAAFKPDNSSQWTEQQRVEWRCENQRRQQQKAKEDEQRRRRSLSAVERDEQYRALLAELTLHPDDRADLVRRGFSHEQIELSGFRSVERYQKLQNQFSDLLPGVASGGKRLIGRDEGYLCPVRDIDGLIVACQIRLRSLPTGESNRYRWLSGHEQTLHLYTTGFNPKAELPLAVHRPTEKPVGIALVEGTGAKPFLTSQRLNALVIGAAGGQFLSSEAILKNSLDKLSRDLNGCKDITIYPDAGDILNSQVMNRWEKVSALLRALGWSVEFGWWGQIDKSFPDIDELEDCSEIQLISTEMFLAMGHPTGDNPYQPTATPQFLNIPRFDWWWKNRGLSGATLVDQKYVNLTRPEDNSILFVNSGTGTGKTTGVKRLVDEYRRTEDVHFLVPGYRNSLLRQISAILDIRHIHESDIQIMSREPGSGVAFCIQSLLKLDGLVGQDYSDKIIFIDECMSVIRDLLTGKTVKNRPETIAKFKRILSGARLVICMDATLSDPCVEFISKCAPNKKVVIIKNTFKGDRPRLNFLIGTFAEDASKVKKNDRSPYFRQMLESKLPAICSDSQIFLEAVEKLLIEAGKRCLRVDSKTIGEEGVKEFLKDCNAYLSKHKIDALLYSPSAESGLDINVSGYFSHHYGFFFGVQGSDAILQMMGRIRDSKCEKFVWIKEYVSVEENPTVEVFFDWMRNDLNKAFSTVETLHAMKNWLERLMVKSVEDFAILAAIDIKEMDIFEKRNLRACTREVFVEAGYDLVEYTLESSVKHTELEKEVKEEVKQEVSQAIFQAEQIPIDGEEDWKELEDLKQSENLEDRWKLENAFLRKRLPGIEKSPVWSKELVYLTKYEDRNFIAHCENYWLLKNQEVADNLRLKYLANLSQKDSIYLADYRKQWATLDAMRELGIEKFLSDGAEWTEDSPELKELVRLAPKFQNALGCKPTNEKGRRIKYLAKLLDKLGMQLKCDRRRVGTKRVRFYKLDGMHQTNTFRIEVLQSITQKWDAENAKNEAENAVEMANELLSKNQPQTHTGKGLEGVPLVANNVYIFESNGTEICEESQCDTHGVTGGDSTQNDVLTPAEELAELLVEFADSPEMFYSLTEFSPANVIEAAIIAAPTAWLRQRWWNFYEALIAPRIAELVAIEDF
jgi:hypothetical protein